MANIIKVASIRKETVIFESVKIGSDYYTDDGTPVRDSLYAIPYVKLTPDELKAYIEFSSVKFSNSKEAWNGLLEDIRKWNDDWSKYPQYNHNQPQPVESLILDLMSKYELIFNKFKEDDDE